MSEPLTIESVLSQQVVALREDNERLVRENEQLRLVVGMTDGAKIVEAGLHSYIEESRTGRRQRVTMMHDELRELERLREVVSVLRAEIARLKSQLNTITVQVPNMADYEDAVKDAARYRKVIDDHNASCEGTCAAQDCDAWRGRGRLCPDCPKHWTIDDADQETQA